ncbi:MAG TPA: hypothetical protein V6D33_12550 [Cyanophyceae cyanobacterium]
MGLIATVLEERKPFIMAQSTVNKTAEEVLTREDWLSPFVPYRELEDFNELTYLVKESAPIAALLGIDQEVPLVSVGEIQKLAYEMFKIGLGIGYTEKMQIQLREALKLSAAYGIEFFDEKTADGQIVKGSNQALARILFGNYRTITNGLFDLTTFLTCLILQYGHISGYNSPLTGVSQSIDYRDKDKDSGFAPYGKRAHFPESLAGTGKAWNQSETATAIEDLREWVDIYSEDAGGPPDAIFWSKWTTRDILKQRSVLRKIPALNAQAGVIVRGVDTMGKGDLRALLEKEELPPFIETDEAYTDDYFEIENGTQKRKQRKIRFMHSRRVTFAKYKMGERLIGPTVEGDFQPGFDVITREVRKRPVQDQTEGVGNILPVFMEPDKLFSREVRDAT